MMMVHRLGHYTLPSLKPLTSYSYTRYIRTQIQWEPDNLLWSVEKLQFRFLGILSHRLT